MAPPLCGQCWYLDTGWPTLSFGPDTLPSSQRVLLLRRDKRAIQLVAVEVQKVHFGADVHLTTDPAENLTSVAVACQCYWRSLYFLSHEVAVIVYETETDGRQLSYSKEFIVCISLYFWRIRKNKFRFWLLAATRKNVAIAEKMSTGSYASCACYWKSVRRKKRKIRLWLHLAGRKL